MLCAIGRRVATTPPDSIRTMPLYLRPLWAQTLSHICAWPFAPFALLVAPRVLLRRRAGDLRERLALFAKLPCEVEKAFWAFAEDDGDDDGVLSPPPASRPAPSQSALVDKMAAQAPAKAIKQLLPKNALRTDKAAVAQLRAKCPAAAADPLPAPIGTKKPEWISSSLLLAVASSQLARLAAPGPCGWTRELVLPSVCASTAPTFEMLINALARGEALLPVPHDDPTKIARVAMWNKNAATSATRIVGMTSVMAKIAWRALLASDRTKFKTQALMHPGGVHSVIRWAQSALQSGKTVFTADVVDAYWGVRRAKVMRWMVEKSHPVTWLFWRTYAASAILEINGAHICLNDGVLPGCGGAAFAFAVDMEHVCGDIPDLKMYADDASLIAMAAFKTFIASCRLAGKSLSKALAIDPRAAEETIVVDGLEVNVVRAARVLGAFLGEEMSAARLLEARVREKISTIQTIVQSTVSTQAKWQMTRSMERSLVWDATATPTPTFLHVAPVIDDAIIEQFKKGFLPEGTLPTHKSIELLFTSNAHGGVGLVNFTADSERLFDMTTASLQGVPIEGSDAVGRLSIQAVRRQMEAAKSATISDKDRRLGRFSDESVPWFNIQHVTTSTTITDEAFKLGMANVVEAQLPHHSMYKSCCDESSFDHSQRCHRCAGPYRYARHQRIQQEFLNCAVAHGIIVTTNFFAIGAEPQGKRPDAIVFRGIANKVPLVIDFACTHQPKSVAYNAMSLIENAKMRKYENYLSQSDGQRVEVQPFVLSSLALMSKRTLQAVEEIGKLATRKGFAYEVVRRTKAAVINFEPFRKHAIAMRHANGTLTMSAGEPIHEGADEDEPETFAT
jgi:hypothetical protein